MAHDADAEAQREAAHPHDTVRTAGELSLYSERFVITDQPNIWRALTIPTDTRAVVRAIDLHNGAGAAGLVQCAVGQTIFFNKVLPATPEVYSLDTRIVLYAGETLSAMVQVAGMVVTVSGYLFTGAGARLELETEDFEDLESVVASARNSAPPLTKDPQIAINT